MELKLTAYQTEISTWVNDYGDRLYAWALHKSSNEQIAQDLVQETFLSAYQHIENFKRGSSPKTWLFSILKNKIIDHFRQVARNKMMLLEDSFPWFDEDENWRKEFRPQPWLHADGNLLDDPEFEKALSHCMNGLPSAWAACVQLKYLDEKNSEEICQQLNITTSNLWQILHRAKLSLRNCLEKNWFKS